MPSEENTPVSLELCDGCLLPTTAAEGETVFLCPRCLRLAKWGERLVEACHGGAGAERSALVSNLRWFADEIEAGRTAGTVITGVLRTYATLIERALARIEEG